jgi:beta-galactosidase
VYQNIGFKANDLSAGQLTVTNKFRFTNLKKFAFTYKITADGKTVTSGELPVLDVAPEQSKQVAIDVKKLKAKPGVEYFVTVSAKTKVAENLLPAGWEIASEQFKLPVEADKKQFNISNTGIVTFKEGASIDISGEDFSVSIDSETGIMTSYKIKGKELFLNGSGPRPVFWRAPIDNDYGWKMPKICRLWKKLSEQALFAESIKTSQKGNAVQVEVIYQLDSVNSTWKTQYIVMGNGAVKIENELICSNDKISVIPRVGMKMQLTPEFTQLEYFGRGPWENYCDRNSSAFVGKYKSTVAGQYVPYIRPQENGHHTDVRWLALTGTDNSGLLLVADSLVGFNALNYTVEDFDAGEDKDKNLLHSNDISPKELVELHVDYRQIGVGGDNSWGARPHDQYMIKPGSREFRYGFVLIPVTSTDEIDIMTKYKF